MRYKKFKNAEIEVSQLAVGTWAIGGQNYGKVDKNEAICAIRRMIENGVNLPIPEDDFRMIYSNKPSIIL